MSNYDVLMGPGLKNHAPIKMWTRGVQVEDAAKTQLLNVASMPFIHKHVAAMPDVHWGMGATVGSVIPTVGAVIPAAVGVDIGCGMIAQRTTLKADQLPDNLSAVRAAIEKAVPHGRTNNGRPGDRGAWHNAPQRVTDAWAAMNADFLALVEKYPTLGRNAEPWRHLGTLGTGNHFIEVCIDQDDFVWIMLHSGSRGLGGRIGSHFIEMAKKDMQRWFVNLPDVDLAYLPEGTEHFDEYVKAVDLAQAYAKTNRFLMMQATIEAMLKTLPTFALTDQAVNCHHNYISREHHFGKNVLVTRKGAVSARLGELGIIPGSMGTRSYIVRGKGNAESFHSCSHGAGRRMSRTEAKKRFTIEDHIAATKGIECRKDADVIDETPMAYKDIDDVMAAQTDLVDVVATLRQVVCVKG